MSKIKELPELERPRERCLRYGADRLSNEELLAIIIGSGYKGVNAKDVAYEIISSSGGISKLYNVSYNGFLSHKGISKVKAITLTAVVELWRRFSLAEAEQNSAFSQEEKIIKYYKTYLKDMKQECLAIICLDFKHKVIHHQRLAKGTNSSLCVSIKDICRIVLDYNAKSFYLVHNHPSGQSSPSKEDIIFTEKLIVQSHNLKLKMIDHIIIGGNSCYSYKNNYSKIV